MSNLNMYVKDCIDKLRGPNRDNVYHALIEVGKNAIPILMEVFEIEQNPDIQRVLIEIIWQHRSPATIGFLSGLLKDARDEIWKGALDGLVTIGGNETIKVLEHAKQQGWASEKIEWIDEAIQQIVQAEGLSEQGNESSFEEDQKDVARCRSARNPGSFE